MRNRMNTFEVRKSIYGDSWRLTNEWLAMIPVEVLQRLITLRLFYVWLQIFAKLARALYSPELLDHWIDISNYARMAILQIKGDQNDKA